MRPTDFWPVAEYARCVRCGNLVKTREAVAMTVPDRLGNDEFDGFAHDWPCVA